MKVLGHPAVKIEPETALVTEGSDVTFTCTAAASSEALTYQWEKNSAVISGETDNRSGYNAQCGSFIKFSYHGSEFC